MAICVLTNVKMDKIEIMINRINAIYKKMKHKKLKAILHLEFFLI